MNFSMEKIYFYIICLLTFFVLLWGAIDFVSAGITYLTTPALSAATPQSQQSLERAEVNFDTQCLKNISTATAATHSPVTVFSYGETSSSNHKGRYR